MHELLQSALPLFLSALPAYASGAFIYLTLGALYPLPKKILLSILIGLISGFLCGLGGAFGDLIIFIVCVLVFIHKQKKQHIPRQQQLAWLITIFNIISLQTTFSSELLGLSRTRSALVVSACVVSAVSIVAITLYMHYLDKVNELVTKLDPKSPLTKSLTWFTLIVFLSQLLIPLINVFTSVAQQNYWLINSFTVLTDIACVFMTISHAQASASIERSHAILASQTATEVFSTKARQNRIENDKLLHDYKNIIQSLQTSYATSNVDLRQELNDAQQQLSAAPSSQFSLDGIEPGLITGLLVNEWLKANQKNVALSLQTNLSNVAFSHGIQLSLNRILGILIDNAIDATADVDDKEVGISLYAEPNNDVTINIRNHVPSTFRMTNLMVPDFTTKGAGHGHGWTIIRELTRTTPSIRCLPQLDATTLTVKVTVDHTEVSYDGI